MTPMEMFALCMKQADSDLQYITLTIPPRRGGRSGHRVRVFPGLMGQNLGTHEDGRIICSVATGDILRWLRGHLTHIEHHAVRLAEDGKDEEADQWMAQYVALRDAFDALPAKWRDGA